MLTALQPLVLFQEVIRAAQEGYRNGKAGVEALRDAYDVQNRDLSNRIHTLQGMYESISKDRQQRLQEGSAPIIKNYLTLLLDAFDLDLRVQDALRQVDVSSPFQAVAQYEFCQLLISRCRQHNYRVEEQFNFWFNQQRRVHHYLGQAGLVSRSEYLGRRCGEMKGGRLETIDILRIE